MAPLRGRVHPDAAEHPEWWVPGEVTIYDDDAVPPFLPIAGSALSIDSRGYHCVVLATGEVKVCGFPTAYIGPLADE